MNKICGLFVILAVFGDLAFCKSVYYPQPYKNQNEDYAGRFFNGLFDSGYGKNEARNNTPITPAPTTSPKPQLTTETVVYYPIYQEQIYDPSFYPVVVEPAYPIFYNAPLDSSQLQIGNFGPYYPIVNNIPSVYSNELPPIPLKPTLFNINAASEIPKPNSPVNVKPNQITKVNPTKAPISPLQRIQNINEVDLQDKVQEALATELNKLIAGFYGRHFYSSKVIPVQENNEPSAKNNTDDGRDEFKGLLSTPEPTDPVTNPPSIGKNIVNSLHQHVNTKIDDSPKKILETDQLILANETETKKTTQGSIDVNLSNIETSQNETDDSRKLGFNEEEESATDVSIDEPPPFLTNLDNNQTVDSKLNDSTTEGGVISRRFFNNAQGNECMEEAIIMNGDPYRLVSCREKSFPGKDNLMKPTRKSDVTYYTKELSTNAPTTTELTSQNLKNDEISSR